MRRVFVELAVACGRWNGMLSKSAAKAVESRRCLNDTSSARSRSAVHGGRRLRGQSAILHQKRRNCWGVEGFIKAKTNCNRIVLWRRRCTGARRRSRRFLNAGSGRDNRVGRPPTRRSDDRGLLVSSRIERDVNGRVRTRNHCPVAHSAHRCRFSTCSPAMASPSCR